MSEREKRRWSSDEISTEIALFPNELDHDAVGLWHIVGAAEGRFNLSGDARTEFVRQVVDAILEAGGVPVRGATGGEYEWILQRHYGSRREEIVSAIISEWHALPDDPTILAGQGVWFARPVPGENYVKMD